MQTKKLKLYLSKNKIQRKIKIYAKKINKLYKGKKIYCIGLLNGALFFMSDLLKQIKIHIVIDTMSISSYIGSQSINKITIHKDISKNIYKQDVLLIEDMIDTGKTLSAVIKQIKSKKPNSLRIVCLADKINAHTNINYKYDALFTIPNEFIVGYGFDYNDQFRQLSNVYILKNI